jgi:hypothetical protein
MVDADRHLDSLSAGKNECIIAGMGEVGEAEFDIHLVMRVERRMDTVYENTRNTETESSQLNV